jgi:hypothetical protein
LKKKSAIGFADFYFSIEKNKISIPSKLPTKKAKSLNSKTNSADCLQLCARFFWNIALTQSGFLADIYWAIFQKNEHRDAFLRPD